MAAVDAGNSYSDVLNTGCFIENRIFRVMADEDGGGKLILFNIISGRWKTWNAIRIIMQLNFSRNILLLI